MSVPLTTRATCHAAGMHVRARRRRAGSVEPHTRAKPSRLRQLTAWRWPWPWSRRCRWRLRPAGNALHLCGRSSRCSAPRPTAAAPPPRSRAAVASRPMVCSSTHAAPLSSRCRCLATARRRLAFTPNPTCAAIMRLAGARRQVSIADPTPHALACMLPLLLPPPLRLSPAGPLLRRKTPDCRNQEPALTGRFQFPPG